MDETRPVIGPNLAGNEALCQAVAQQVYEYFYPYMLMQQRMWPTWDRIDDAWRVKGKRSDLDISYTDPASVQKSADGKGDGLTDPNDGISAKITPAAFHKQVRSKTDMHMSIAWADGMPVRAMKPETLYEHPLYNPTTQGVDSFNELLRQCAEAVGMKKRDRKIRGSWSKYGHCWLGVDFKYRLRDEPVSYALPLNQFGQPDPQRSMQMIQQVSAMFGGQPPQWGQGPRGERTAVWTRRVVDADSMVTDFVPLRHDAVFVDQTLPADEMERQECPLVCGHITTSELWGNDYDPEMNPFGWLNTAKARANGGEHYVLGDQSEGNFRRELAKKFGLNDTPALKARHSMKQLWTAYPMLAINPDLAIDPKAPPLDKGDGIECRTCRGKGQIDAATMQGGAPAQYSTLPEVMPPVVIGGGDMTPQIAQTRQPCPDCQGIGKRFIEPKRYVVQGFGLLSTGQTRFTVLRIQPNPTVKNRVPLIFGAHLKEDTAGAIPLSVSEASLAANDQLATAHNQLLDAKNMSINRQWIMGADEPAMKMDCNRPGRNIPREGPPGSVEPAPTIAYDLTANLSSQYIPQLENEVQQIHGLPDTLLGIVSSGRRAATEIQTASDAAKLPITVEIDSCNTQIHGVWAQMHLDNLEAYADRDWIQRRTGRTTFGKLQLHTAVAADFFTEQAKLQLLQNFLPAAIGIPGFNVARAAQEIFKLAGFDDASEFIDDGGVRKAQMDCLRVIAQILGEGIPVPPSPDDPHEVYIAMFQEALKDNYWRERTPENLPLLFQRMQIQMTMQQEKMLMQMQQQAAQQMLMAPEGGQPSNGQRPPNGSRIPANQTQARQQSAGRNAPQRN